MYKVNLIRGWQKTTVYKSYRNQILLSLGGIALVMITVYFFLFARFLYLQKQLTEISNQQFLGQNNPGFTTEELTKTIYSLKKLEQIRTIYSQYPEFYLYHNFLLKKILRYSSLTINRYTLNREHAVEVAVETKSLSDLFELINLLESNENAQYFTLFEVNNIGLNKSKADNEDIYKMDFKLQFNEKLLNEKNKL